MSLEEGDDGLKEVQKRLEDRLKVRLKTKKGQRGLKMPVAKIGDFVRLRIPKENKHHFYTDNWSSVVYRVRSRRDPQPLIGYPSTQTRRVYTIENAETGELKTNKAGAAMEYTAFELLKIPTRQNDDGTVTYHAQILPSELSKKEMLEICGKCSISAKDAERLVEESEVIQPEDEVDLDKLPIMKRKPSLREAFEEIDAEIGKAEGENEKFVALILGLKRLLLNNEWFEDGPAWPIPIEAQGQRIYDAVEVSVIQYAEPSFRDIRNFAVEMKNTKHLEKVLKEYLSGGVIAKNVAKEEKSKNEFVVGTVAPLGQGTVQKGLKKLDKPKKVKVLKKGDKKGHFVYTFRNESSYSLFEDEEDQKKAPSEHFYFFSTSDEDKIIIPIYWGARIALESVLFTPKIVCL